MLNFLVPVIKDHFLQYYRFGYTYIPKSSLMIFDGSISDITKKNLASHFAQLSPFEYDGEYLVLHLTKATEIVDENVLFDITDIAAIYPISEQAKSAFEDKNDKRIRLEQPVFDNVLPIIEFNIQKREIEKAIDALWTIFGVSGEKNEILEIIGLDNIYDGLKFRQSGTKAFNIENGNYWSILIAYDRYEYYPNEIIGYYFDAAQVFAHSKNQASFEGSGLHKLMTNLDVKAKSEKILKALEESELSQSYCLQTTFNQMKGYIVAPLFLMLKADIRDNDDIYSTKLFRNPEFFQKFGNEFKAALILLGAFFGFKKFYDLYYDKANLRFYKSYSPEMSRIAQLDAPITCSQPVENAETVNEVSTEEVAVTIKEEIMQEPEQGLEDKGKKEQKNKRKSNQKNKVEHDINDEINKLRTTILELINSKKDISITNLREELLNQFKIKKSNAVLENIINEISQLEIYQDKKASPKKVRIRIVKNPVGQQGQLTL